MSNAIGRTLARILRPWFTKKVQTQPDFVIGPHDDPYMHRWYVIPKNRFFNIYLHEFWRSDEPRALHDHPWWSLSVLLRGYLYDVTEDDVCLYEWGSIKFRFANEAHRIVFGSAFYPPSRGRTISLFITGPRIREWGFLCPKGWVHWKDFTSNTDGNSKAGRGCDD